MERRGAAEGEHPQSRHENFLAHRLITFHWRGITSISGDVLASGRSSGAAGQLSGEAITTLRAAGALGTAWGRPLREGLHSLRPRRRLLGRQFVFRRRRQLQLEFRLRQ
jgi:hypothetical protein